MGMTKNNFNLNPGRKKPAIAGFSNESVDLLDLGFLVFHVLAHNRVIFPQH